MRRPTTEGLLADEGSGAARRGGIGQRKAARQGTAAALQGTVAVGKTRLGEVVAGAGRRRPRQDEGGNGGSRKQENDGGAAGDSDGAAGNSSGG